MKVVTFIKCKTKTTKQINSHLQFMYIHTTLRDDVDCLSLMLLVFFKFISKFSGKVQFLYNYILCKCVCYNYSCVFEIKLSDRDHSVIIVCPYIHQTFGSTHPMTKTLSYVIHVCYFQKKNSHKFELKISSPKNVPVMIGTLSIVVENCMVML